MKLSMPIPDKLGFKKICPFIQRPCIKEQCLAYEFFSGYNGNMTISGYKCKMLDVNV